jgi:radical SAM protein with 4Fe4S-binding SPASM domain
MSDKQLLWDITGRCNLLCRHCYAYDKYEWNRPGPRRPDMTTGEAKAFLQKLKEMGFRHLHLLGGEPLHRPDALEVLAYARLLGLKVTMNTNGLLLEPLIDPLIDLGIYQIAVSFEGTAALAHDAVRGRGTFEKARANLKRLGDRVKERKADMLVGVGFVVTKKGLGDVEHLIPFALDNSANGLTVDFLAADGRALQFMDRLECSEEEAITALERMMETGVRMLPPGFVLQVNTKPRLRRYLSERYGVALKGEAFGDRCPAGDHTLLVENDGVTTPCGILNKKSKNAEAVAQGQYTAEPLNIWNITSFQDLQQSTFFRTFREFKNRHHGTVGTCRTCEFVSTCQPCPIDWLDETEVRECVVAEERRQAWRASVWNEPWLVQVPEVPAMNATARRILAGLGAHKSPAQLCCEIAEAAGVPEVQVETDLWAFLMQLRTLSMAKPPVAAEVHA